MKRPNWRATAELVTLAALVGSLVFVGLQLRQAHVIAKIGVYTTLLSSTVEARNLINQSVDIWVKGAAGQELSETEQSVFDNLVTNLNDQAVTAHWGQLLLGNTQEADIVLHDFAAFLHQNPGARRVWQAREENLNHYRRRLGRNGDLFLFWQERIVEDLRKLEQSSQ